MGEVRPVAGGGPEDRVLNCKRGADAMRRRSDARELIKDDRASQTRGKVTQTGAVT